MGLASPERRRPLTERTMSQYPPAHYVSIAPVKVDEHRYRCPICHEVVDSRDFDTVSRHL